jgi:multimeric flavodoxin WrbA
MLVIGVAGSPRKGGNTEIVVKEALKVSQEEGLLTEFIHLADVRIHPCNECMVCKKKQICPIDDDFSSVYDTMLKADGIILGSPVFFSSATPEIKALIDRTGYLAIAQERPLERKVGGALVVGRRAGHNFVFAELLFFFLYHGMVVPGSSYWNVGFGKEPGEVLGDEEGMNTVRQFARNMSWVIKKIR